MGGGEVLKKGWLIKSPPLETGRIKNWRKRWFCLLSSKVLEYYKSDERDQRGAKGVINLEDCKAVNSGLAHKKYKFVFDVETRDRTYYLVANSQEEMKSWVDAICKVCAFSAFQVPTISAHQGQTIPLSGGGGDSPVISVPFNDRFKPSENGATQDQLYSLATSVGSEVQRQLSGGEQDVPAGVPLSEALYSKGLSSGHRSGSVSMAESSSSVPSSTTLPSRLASDSPYGVYSQAVQPPVDPSALYSVSTKAKSHKIDPHSAYASPRECMPPGSASLDPLAVSKARAATLNPAIMTYDTPRPAGGHFDQRSMTQVSGGSAQFSSSLGGAGGVSPFSPPVSSSSPYPPPLGGADTSSMVGSGRAELLENNYMTPRIPPNKRSNYDYPPFGPPRPADFPGQGEISPRAAPRSALLRNDSSSSVGSEQPKWGISPSDTQTRTYVNMQQLREEPPEVSPRGPPPIDRSTKPPEPTPPRVNRELKPSVSCKISVPTAASDSSGGDDSPPNFPKRVESLGQLSSEDSAFDSDVPKPTARSTKYTPVEFDPTAQKMVMSPVSSDPDVRRPIPAPRTMGVKAQNQSVTRSDSGGAKRVNYSDVDLQATEELALKRNVTLRQAENEYLAGKPYVNINRDQVVEEETDPEYYTHMRNFTFEEADQPYCTMHRYEHDKYNEEGHELYEEPPRQD